MKLSELIDRLKELPGDSEVDFINGDKKVVSGDVIIIQAEWGALRAVDREKFLNGLSAYGIKNFAYLEYAPGRGPLQFLGIRGKSRPIITFDEARGEGSF